ncbi:MULTISPECIES: DUF262 domain-containing protein [unclassified Bacillus cereus group]|uniref:DUF262 domain-containing protein n=1 Tax=unclassified Bacillus cereus group TaxID=2750818 RepID=UPI001F59098A|nr:MULTISPECIES: DUF262 domain-containing protein [unclassified Bacillus cereus group]
MPRKTRKTEERKPLTIEERREIELHRLRTEISFTPSPTYQHRIGDSVNVGSLENAKIEAVYDDGRFYEVFYQKKIKVGGDKKYTNAIDWYEWMKVRTIPDDSGTNFVKENNVRLEFFQITVNSLLHKLYHFGIDTAPIYQRDYVWSQEDKESLIDSIFNHVEIGKFVLIFRGYQGDMYEVLDGKQRLSALQEFFEDRFTYKGKHFSQLTQRDQNHFKNYAISLAESQLELTEKQKLEYFIRLNKTGRVMDKEHLEKVEALYTEILE